MHVTLDTNVIGPLACPELYSTCPDLIAIDVIRESICTKIIHAYISEASMSIEAISNEDRLDIFFRQWATMPSRINLPEPAPERIQIFDKVIKLGIKVLHVPRIALRTFIKFPQNVWAEDINFSIKERHDRYSKYIRSQPNTGVESIKRLGAELVTIHGLRTDHLTHLVTLPSWPTAEELMWMDGLLAEYDSPKKFSTRKRFLTKFRDLVAEWFDLDIQASHYSYGFDYLCTFDSANNTGINGIMHANRILINSSLFNIKIIKPSELVSLIT